MKIQPFPDSDTVQVLVLTHEGRSFGLVVDKIIDIVEDSAEVKSAATRAGVLHSIVISERVTELLDIPAILRVSEVAHTQAAPAGGGHSRPTPKRLQHRRTSSRLLPTKSTRIFRLSPPAPRK